MYPEFSSERLLLQLVFAWFSINTIISILSVLTSDPGYIDSFYKHPLKSDGTAPLEKLRTFNAEVMKRNNLYDFSIVEDEENGGLISDRAGSRNGRLINDTT